MFVGQGWCTHVWEELWMLVWRCGGVEGWKGGCWWVVHVWALRGVADVDARAGTVVRRKEGGLTASTRASEKHQRWYALQSFILRNHARKQVVPREQVTAELGAWLHSRARVHVTRTVRYK